MKLKKYKKSIFPVVLASLVVGLALGLVVNVVATRRAYALTNPVISGRSVLGTNSLFYEAQATPPAACDPNNNKVLCGPKGIGDCSVSKEGACNLYGYISLAISFAAVLIGIIATALIIIGGIQYSAAGSDPGAVQKAKGRIGKAIGMIVGFGLLYAIVQWLVPGGIF